MLFSKFGYIKSKSFTLILFIPMYANTFLFKSNVEELEHCYSY